MEIEEEKGCNEKIFNSAEFLSQLIKTLEVKDVSPENSQENLSKYSLVQLIQFLNILNSSNLFDDLSNSPFYFPLVQMRHEEAFKDLVEKGFLDSKLALINLKSSNAFVNRKISQNLARKLKVLGKVNTLAKDFLL